MRYLIAHRAAQRWVARLERVEQRGLSSLAVYFKRYFMAGMRQRAQMGGEHDADHGSV